MANIQVELWAFNDNGWKLNLNFSIDNKSLSTYSVELKGEENWHRIDCGLDYDTKIPVNIYWLNHEPNEVNFQYNGIEYKINIFKKENNSFYAGFTIKILEE